MNLSEKKLKKLTSREYRESYLREIVIGWVVNQIKALRRQRGWTQERLAKESNKQQSVIARIESETYGNWNTNTLLDLASAFDVALEIRFVSWPRFLQNTDDTSVSAMYVPSFSRDQFLVRPLYHDPLRDFGESQRAVSRRRGSADQVNPFGQWARAVQRGDGEFHARDLYKISPQLEHLQTKGQIEGLLS